MKPEPSVLKQSNKSKLVLTLHHNDFVINRENYRKKKKKKVRNRKRKITNFFRTVTINLLLNISLIKLQVIFTTNVKILK